MKIYKVYVTKREHELAGRNGRVRLSRWVLYEKLNGEAGCCHWCQVPLTWETVCADHLDSNFMNDVAENLVGSCRGCNANRDDGTGYGRKVPKECPECHEHFVSKEHHRKTIYCSNSCASKNRPLRGITALHGTRSRYVTGCRCTPCHNSNLRYSRDFYARNGRSRR